MTALAINRSGFDLMTGDGDGSGWTAIVGTGSGILGLLAGIFFKGLGYANVRGRTDGVLEAQIAALTLRITSLEVRKDRMDLELREMATKEDVSKGFERGERQMAAIEHQVDSLMKMLYETRGHRPPAHP